MKALIYDTNTLEEKSVQSVLIENQIDESYIYKPHNLWEAFQLTERCDFDLMLIALGSGPMNEEINQASINFVGMALQKRPETNIIFLADDARYAMEAFSLDASGYLVRPVTKEAINHQLKRLRYTAQPSRRKVYFQCFGNFECYVDGQPVKFQYSKTKEVLAYLVDRHGCLCTMGEIMSVLWQDDNNHLSYFKTIRKDLYDTLEALDCLDLILKQRNRIGLNLNLCSCDYYEWEKKHVSTFHGEYMRQYSWAEFTTGLLLNVREESDRYDSRQPKPDRNSIKLKSTLA